MFLAGLRSKERDWIAHREIPVYLAVGQVARNLVSIPLQRPEISAERFPVVAKGRDEKET